ncbi:MAG TPA: hypothetical protein VHP58_01400 [Alphaproteobacteria bacterium]|nr:hypothetical protein [Alphaproteobacteria bacterium]
MRPFLQPANLTLAAVLLDVFATAFEVFAETIDGVATATHHDGTYGDGGGDYEDC